MTTRSQGDAGDRSTWAARTETNADTGGLPPRDWPNRSCSRRVRAADMDWHVQRAGTGPRLLLLHGTGASSHSWRELLPRLAEHHDVLAPDLPGHGYSAPMAHGAPSLPGMAQALGDLLAHCDFAPDLVIGHSAGAALMIRMALDETVTPRVLVGLNAALMPYGGLLAPIAQPLARVFAASGLVAELVAAQARRPGTVERLISGTGSRLAPDAVEDYRRLLGRSAHVGGTLDMMANWDLRGLLDELPDLAPSLCLVVGENDRTVPPRQAGRIATRARRGRVIRLAALGHLAHEERPDDVLAAIEEAETWGDESP